MYAKQEQQMTWSNADGLPLICPPEREQQEEGRGLAAALARLQSNFEGSLSFISSLSLSFTLPFFYSALLFTVFFKAG